MDRFQRSDSSNSQQSSSTSQEQNESSSISSNFRLSNQQNEAVQTSDEIRNQQFQQSFSALSSFDKENKISLNEYSENANLREKNHSQDCRNEIVQIFQPDQNHNNHNFKKRKTKNNNSQLDCYGKINSESVKKNKQKYSEYLINKYLNSQSLFTDDKKFYIFSEVILDVNYFKNLSKKDEYIKETKLQQYQKGLRYINKIIHRIDNKFLEVDISYFPQKLNDIKGIIYMLNSLGDQNLQKFVEDLQQLWNIVIQFQLFLKQEHSDLLFQKHFELRESFCEEKYQQIVQSLDPNQLIMYTNHYPNYEKLQYSSRLMGFSPELYELVAINSYIFQDYVQQNGCCDPRTIFHYFNNTLQEALQYLYAMQQGYLPEKMTIQLNTELVTFDGFIFPVKQTSDIYLLGHEYDRKNGLNFKSQQILIVHTFQFFDEEAQKDFKLIRQQHLMEFQNSSLDNVEKKMQQSNKTHSQIELVNKYYGDSVADLYQYGNKWLKRCGFVDIKKKNKLNNL